MEKNCEGGGAVIANVLERPRRDTNGGFETEVTVTSERATSKSRKSEEREKKTENRRDASFGGAVRDSVLEDELLRAPRDPAASTRHGLVLVCYARLAPAPSPSVLADAAPSALLALAPSPSVLADARPAALLARAPLTSVLSYLAGLYPHFPFP